MGAPLHCYTCAGGGQILGNSGKAEPTPQQTKTQNPLPHFSCILPPNALYCLHLPSIPCLDNLSHWSLTVGDVHFDNFGPDHPPNYSTLPPVASLVMHEAQKLAHVPIYISYINHAQNTAHAVKTPLPGRLSSLSSFYRCPRRKR